MTDIDVGGKYIEESRKTRLREILNWKICRKENWSDGTGQEISTIIKRQIILVT